MNAASNSGGFGSSDDRWLDEMLSQPPTALPDDGFTARVMTRLRLQALVRPAALGGLGLLGIAIALRFTSLDAAAALLPGERVARLFDALPTIDIPPGFEGLPAFGAVDFTSPLAFTVIAAAILTWLIQETA